MCFGFILPIINIFVNSESKLNPTQNHKPTIAGETETGGTNSHKHIYS